MINSIIGIIFLLICSMRWFYINSDKLINLYNKKNNIKYKSFRKQSIECKKKKIQKEINCYRCGQKIILCTKYDDICHSKICLKERRRIK